MKKYFSYMQVFTLLTILLLGTACNGQLKNNLPKEKVSESNIIDVAHPKLINTIVDPRFGDV
jgi:hypothetical protein